MAVTPPPPFPVRTPDGRRLDVYVAGPPDGTTLLFHVGTPAAPIPYPPALAQMADRGLRYVSFSRPGYGSSTRRPGRSVADVVDDAVTVLDHVGASTAVTIGWSGGGPHALACATLLPDRIRAVATMGGVAPYGADGLDYVAGMGEENIEEVNATLAGPDELIVFKERNWPIFRAVTAAEVAKAFGDLVDDVDRGALTGEFAEWTAASFREALRESYWGWFDDDLALIRPWGFDLGQIRVPVHVWQGRHDRMVPYAHGEWLASHIPTAVPHLFDDQGHLSLAVDAFGSILDHLVAGYGAISPHQAAMDARADEFGRLVDAAIAAIPEPFASQLASVAIVIEDEASPHQLGSVGAGGLFGLYQGVPRTRWGAEGAPVPSKITIFRGPLERAHRHPASLAAAVQDVVRHEIAHHFGISDDRLRELQRQ